MSYFFGIDILKAETENMNSAGGQNNDNGNKENVTNLEETRKYIAAYKMENHLQETQISTTKTCANDHQDRSFKGNFLLLNTEYILRDSIRQYKELHSLF